jgi:hypothetical protein
VGRTPWSARVPPDPRLANEITFARAAGYRRGRRLRTVVRPTMHKAEPYAFSFIASASHKQIFFSK